MSKVYMYGVDISTWQGNIDLTPYKDQFVIIRAGHGTTVDSKAVRNMDQCDKLGIPYGVYWYSYALNVADAEKEADICIKTIKNRNIRVGVWFDMEDADGYKKKNGMPSNTVLVNMCNAFCKKIVTAGYYAGVYASESWFNNQIKNQEYPKWVANWGSNNGKLNNDKSDIAVLHQYTSKPLDKDVMYVDLSTFSNKASVIEKKKSNEEIAKEVIDGKWGSGETRKNKLIESGYDYNAIQAIVNELLTPKKTIDEIAKEVLDGKWGNGDEREKNLKSAGYDYTAIQNKVNELVASQTTYTIKFNANGGTGTMKPINAKKGAKVILTANAFKRAGYKFIGWAVKSDKSKIILAPYQIGVVTYKNKATVKDLGDVTLYAVWYGNGAQAACDWAVRIASDDSFSYGKKPYASKCGCYFCKTNDKKKAAAKKAEYYSGDKWDKTYVCSTLVNAAYAHGANNSTFLKPEKKGGIYISGSCSATANKKKSALGYLGKPKIADLQAGDILVKDGKHTSMYIGDKRFVEATSSNSAPFGKDTIRVKALTTKIYSAYTDVFRVK